MDPLKLESETPAEANEAKSLTLEDRITNLETMQTGLLELVGKFVNAPASQPLQVAVRPCDL